MGNIIDKIPHIPRRTRRFAAKSMIIQTWFLLGLLYIIVVFNISVDEFIAGILKTFIYTEIGGLVAFITGEAFTDNNEMKNKKGGDND